MEYINIFMWIIVFITGLYYGLVEKNLFKAITLFGISNLIINQ